MSVFLLYCCNFSDVVKADTWCIAINSPHKLYIIFVYFSWAFLFFSASSLSVCHVYFTLYMPICHHFLLVLLVFVILCFTFMPTACLLNKLYFSSICRTLHTYWTTYWCITWWTRWWTVDQLVYPCQKCSLSSMFNCMICRIFLFVFWLFILLRTQASVGIRKTNCKLLSTLDDLLALSAWNVVSNLCRECPILHQKNFKFLHANNTVECTLMNWIQLI